MVHALRAQIALPTYQNLHHIIHPHLTPWDVSGSGEDGGRGEDARGGAGEAQAGSGIADSMYIELAIMTIPPGNINQTRAREYGLTFFLYVSVISHPPPLKRSYHYIVRRSNILALFVENRSRSTRRRREAYYANDFKSFYDT